MTEIDQGETCACGKAGWVHQENARRKMTAVVADGGGPRRRRQKPGRLEVYRCKVSESGLWHFGHGLR